MGLFEVIIEVLDGSLHPVPAHRLSADSLLLALKHVLNEQYYLHPSPRIGRRIQCHPPNLSQSLVTGGPL